MEAMQDAHSQSPSGQEAAPPSLKSVISVWMSMVMAMSISVDKMYDKCLDVDGNDNDS